MGVKCHPCVLKLLKQWHDKYEVKGGADRVAYTHTSLARAGGGGGGTAAGVGWGVGGGAGH